MIKNKIVMLVLGCSFVTFAGEAFAVPTFGTIDEFDGTMTTWAANDAATINPPQNPSLTFTIGSIGEVAGYGGVYTTDPLLTGNYPLNVPNATISFDFTGSVAANEMSLYFYSTTTAQTWLYSESVYDGTHSIGLGTYSGWVTFDAAVVDAGETDFYNSIADVTRIGIYVANLDAGDYVYTLDNFGMPVPEPETVWMILAVVLSLGVTFRGQLAEMAGQVKARVLKG